MKMTTTGYKVWSLLGIVTLFWLTGCSSSSSLSGARMEWTTQINYDRIETSHVEPDRGSVLVGEGKNFILFDGQRGSSLRHEPESKGIGGMFKSMVKEGVSIEVEGIEVTDLFSEADRFSFAFLDFADAMIILDYTSDSDIIRMIDMTTGEELWKSEDYQWSLARYQNIAGEVTKGVMQNIGLGAAAATGVTGAELTRERFAQNLVAPVPELNSLLFRTTEGLLLLDARTAEVKWSMDDFDASGISHVKYLPETNDLLLISYVSHLFDALQDNRQVMRVDPSDGTVKWSAKYQHASRYIQGVDYIDERVMIRYMGSQAEVFDLESGEMLASTDGGATSGMQRWVDSQSEDSTYIQAPARIIDNILYTVEPTEAGLAKRVHFKIAAYDLENGDQKWVTEPFENGMFISSIYNYGDQLIANLTDSEAPVITLNKEDGSIAWSITDLDKSAHTHFDGEKLYIAQKNSVRSVDPETGKTINEISLEEKGLGFIQDIDRHNDNIYVTGAKGVATYTADNLEEINVWLPKGQIEESRKIGNRLFVQTTPLLGFNTYLRVMNLNNGKQITELKVDPGMRAWFGNFRNGVFIPNDGESVYLLDEEKKLTKYSIIPDTNQEV